jgi:phosphatidylglycerol lysyltransferase
MASTDRDKVLALVHRYGWNATAFQTLEPGYSYLFVGDDACVAYIDTGSAWVAAGAPIAKPEAIGAVAARFVEAAQAAGKRSCFFATEDRLTDAAAGELMSVGIGEQPVWDPRGWTAILAKHRSLREQLRRARAKDVRIRELTPAEMETGPIREEMTRLADRWLATRAMAPMGFVVQIDLFSFAEHRRCFVAEIDARLIGFAGVVPVPARNGWFIEDLLRDPSAPNGTGELLVDAVMRWAASEGSEWVTLGLAPLAGDVAGPLRAVRSASQLLYNFDGVHVFKAKMRPNAWTPIYLAYPPSQGTLISIIDSLAAFTRGGFIRFGLRTLLRGPTAAVRLLAALLVPWTILLALAPTEPWFPAPWIKWAWVGFDVAVAAGLFRLHRRYAPKLATTLAVAVTGDAILTAVQAALWNLPRADGVVDYLAIALACFAPVLASIVLWGAVRMRRHLK